MPKIQLPGTATTGTSGHIADHNTIRDGLSQLASTTPVRASVINSYGHSYTQWAVSESTYTYQELVRTALGALTVNDYGVAGTAFVSENSWVKAVQSTNDVGIHRTEYHDDDYSYYTYYSARRGVDICCWGINDAGDWFMNADATRTVTAWKHILRAVLSRFQLSTLHESPSKATLNGTGWETISSTTQNSGTGYSQTTSNSASVQIDLPTTFLGGIVSLFFLTNEHTGTLPASVVTFTVDGVAKTPIGFTNNQLDCRDYPPQTSATAGYAVARLRLTAGAHTIVATGSTGGMTFDCWGTEATQPKPVLWANIARIPIVSGASVSNISTLNDASAKVIKEFATPAVVMVDIDAVLKNDPKNFFRDLIHPNDLGHALIANAMILAYNNMVLSDLQKVNM